MASNQEFYDEFKQKFRMPPFFINNDALANAYFNYERIESIANWFQTRGVNIKPKIAIICGSGLGTLADHVANPISIPYEDIPNFPQSTVHGHSGNLVFGDISNVPVVAMQGRFHPYEGYTTAVCTLPIKVFKLLGVKLIILTNAAGGINTTYKVGDLMILKDHMSHPTFTLQHPLVGPNDERFGPRFMPINKIYTKSLRDMFREVAEQACIPVHEGVYSVIGGPTYETVSEVIYLQKSGADAVGMSTAHEAIVAAYCGMKVFALSVITDAAVAIYDCQEESNHEEIVQVAKKRTDDVVRLVIKFIEKIHQNGSLLD